MLHQVQNINFFKEVIRCFSYVRLIEETFLVASGFPSGQMPLKTRLEEIEFAVLQGAKEIDIVIDRSLVLTGQWHLLYQEIQQMKHACGPDAHLKAILACGELGTLENV